MAIKIKYKKISKSKGRNFCDELWAISGKIKDGGKCAICSSTEYLQSHHLISRRVLKFRHKLLNSIVLCPAHHEYSLLLSAHSASWNFHKWLEENRKEQNEFFCSNRDNIESDEEIDYEKTYLELEEQYKQLTGNYYKIERLTQYLLAKNIDLIKTKIKENKKPSEILQDLNFVKLSEKTLKDFITLNKKYFST